MDFNNVFADCFSASEMESLFSSQEHEGQDMRAYGDGTGPNDIGENDTEKPSWRRLIAHKSTRLLPTSLPSSLPRRSLLVFIHIGRTFCTRSAACRVVVGCRAHAFPNVTAGTGTAFASCEPSREEK